jgi:chaperonin GroES
MKLVPLSDRVVLQQLEAEVIAVGPGGVVDGKEIVMQVKEGQKVIYSKYSGTEVKLDGEEYIIVKQNDILAIVE